MNNNLPDVKYTKGVTNPTVDSVNAIYSLEFYKESEYFFILENFVSFIKKVEQMFRTSDEYKRYIGYLKNTVGLSTCQIHGNIDNESGATIEMHHGPCLNLFDVTAIIVDDQLKRQQKISTFSICNLLSEEHYNNNIQIVMLSKTDHELVHSRDVFVHYRQAFGDLNTFLKKYKAGVGPDAISKIQKYIDLCKENECFSNEILTVSNTINKWNDKIDSVYY